MNALSLKKIIGEVRKHNGRVTVHKEQTRNPTVRNSRCCEHFEDCTYHLRPSKDIFIL